MEAANLPRCLLWGLDSLYVSYFFHAKQSQIDWDDFAYQKEKLRADGNSEGAEISLGSQRFMLQPYGSQPYSYVLRNRLFVVRLAENLNPSCNVQFLSKGLWKHGLPTEIRTPVTTVKERPKISSEDRIVGRSLAGKSMNTWRTSGHSHVPSM